MTVRVVHRLVTIAAEAGSATMDLSQVGGVVLALSWIVGDTQRVWGSAVMVAPGVAITARHVVDEMRRHGFLSEGGGYLLAYSFDKDGMTIWNPNSLTTVGAGDLAILTLVRATHGPLSDRASPHAVDAATIAARSPDLGEKITLFGFEADQLAYEAGGAVGLSLHGSVGHVLDVYHDRRDNTLPCPSAAIGGKTVGGMSGGPAFDAQGRLVGIISSGIGDDPSFITLTWPSLFTPLTVAWPPGLIESPTTLRKMALDGFCSIEEIEQTHSHTDQDGTPYVSLVRTERTEPESPF